MQQRVRAEATGGTRNDWDKSSGRKRGMALSSRGQTLPFDTAHGSNDDGGVTGVGIR